ncbi:flagellar hook assembly protein FlgD [Modestobacter excelsi]|uniref:flagellar hook assembly protein FlgD n=1 Tax=Modestobacter excelsi TaxID=2213161 RepID=UPI00110CE282|nr:flagellar hook capping FlgD N-terminal domain-containing protein [Modestobacter excelsi]
MTAPVSGPGQVATHNATTQVSGANGFDSETFLKLLVAQLKYQDPSDPASSSELMAQTATLAQVQSLDAIAKQNSQSLTLQKSLSAGALVGQTVSYTDSDGATRTGVVTAVKISSDSTAESQAVIGGVDVDLARISQVALPTPATGTSATS